MKRLLHYSLLILVLNASFLFSPKPVSKDHYCGVFVDLGEYAGYTKNCDGFGFVARSIDPHLLMEQNDVRQSRPLYIVAAGLVGYGFYYAAKPLAAIRDTTLEESTYAAYVFLNFVLLLLALFLFEKIADRLTDGAIPHATVLALGVFLISNDVTKAFFWTAHQQMFSLVIPLISIYISTEYINDISGRRMVLLSLLLGLGLLAYGSFLVSFVSILLCFLYKSRETLRKRSTGLILLCASCCVVFVAPTLFWILILKFKGVTYYSHELVAYKQLIWITESLKNSTSAFLDQAKVNFISFGTTLSCLYVALSMLAVAMCVKKFQTSSFWKFEDDTNVILLNLVCFAGFFLILGYYSTRLTLTLMPILLCLTVGCMTKDFFEKSARIFLFFIACLWHCVNVFSYGPFS